MKYLYFAVFALFAVGCGHPATTPNDAPEITFTRTDFLQNDTLTNPDTILFDKSLAPDQYNVLRDTLLFVSGKNPEHFLEVYSLNSGELLATAAPKGKGPNEFLMFRSHFHVTSDDEFYLHDQAQRTFYIYNVDSLLEQKEFYHPPLIHVPYAADHIYRRDSTTLLYSNRNYFENEDYSNGQPRIGVIDLTQPLERSPELKYFPFNVSCGYLIPNPKTGDLIWADYYTPTLIFLDSTLTETKRMTGPDIFNMQYTIIPGDEHEILFKKNTYRAYYGLVVKDSCFYLLYNNVDGTLVDDEDDTPMAPNELFQIGWDGKLLRRIQFTKPLLYISVDSKGEYLYGTAVDRFEGDAPTLVRYKLK